MFTKVKYLFMSLAFGTMLVLNISNVAFAADDEDNVAKSLFTEGRQFMENRQYNQAVEKFQLALTKNITEYNKSLLYMNLGECYEELYDLSNAEDNYKKALLARNPAPSIALGDFYERHKEYDKAISVMKNLFETDGTVSRYPNKFAASYLILASCYQKTSAWQECIDICNKYITGSKRSSFVDAVYNDPETDILIYMQRALSNANLQHSKEVLKDLNIAEKMCRKHKGNGELKNKVAELREATLNLLKAYMTDAEYQDFLKRLK